MKLEVISFVKGAVATRDLVPSLTHFLLRDGYVLGYDGKVALCAKSGLDIAAVPKAVLFRKALEACKTVPSFTITKTGRLSIKAGVFKAIIECFPMEDFPDIRPEGEYIQLRSNIVPSIAMLAPFIAEDASRAWARGIYFNGNYANVTNNIILIQKWLDFTLPSFILPARAIKEIIRIGEPPIAIQLGPTSVTFHYKEEKWLYSRLVNDSWPDMGPLLNCDDYGDTPAGSLFDAMEDLLPFVDDDKKVYLTEEGVATSLDPEVATSFDVEHSGTGCFNINQLLLLRKVAHKINFEGFPKPCPFIGENLRGIIVGMI